MTAYLVRRLASGVGLILLLTFLTYGVFFLIPTNPACLLVDCGPHNRTTPEQFAEARRQLGLDRPFLVQYGDFLWHLVRHGTLTTFRIFQVPVTEAFSTYTPATLSVVAGGAVLLVLLALPLGALSALRPHGLLDRGILAVSFLGIALHPFVVGLLLRRLLSLDLGIAPYSGYCPISGREPVAPVAPGQFGAALPAAGAQCSGLVQWAYHLYLPWICFALFFLPLYTRMFRTRVLGTLGEPFVRTARAKGASEARVLRGHVLRNAILPILPMLAMDVGTAITTAIYIEAIFDIHGLGTYAVGALSGESGTYDLSAIMQVVFVVAVAVVVLNLIADLVLVAVDPRITGRSGRRGFWRAADGGIARRRVALASAAMALVVGCGVALAQRPGGGSGAAVADFTAGARKVAGGWSERLRFGSGSLPVEIRQVSAGPNGWAVRARVANPTREPVAVLPAPPDTVDGRSGGFSLQYVGDAKIGVKDYHGFIAAPATAFEPALPASIPPGGAWAGTFAGPAKLPLGTLVYVGFGTFTSPGAGGLPLTLVTNTAFKLH